jgi:hypothetical protein
MEKHAAGWFKLRAGALCKKLTGLVGAARHGSVWPALTVRELSASFIFWTAAGRATATRTRWDAELKVMGAGAFSRALKTPAGTQRVAIIAAMPNIFMLFLNAICFSLFRICSIVLYHTIKPELPITFPVFL